MQRDKDGQALVPGEHGLSRRRGEQDRVGLYQHPAEASAGKCIARERREVPMECRLPSGQRDAGLGHVGCDPVDASADVLGRRFGDPVGLRGRAEGAPLVAAPRQADKHLGPRVRAVDLNEGEARQLSGETNLMKAAKFMMAQGTKAVIIKKGEHGVLFFSKDFHFSAPAYLLENISDPTGAGDTFAGGMIGYLSHTRKVNERNIRKSLIYGNIMASFVVEDFSVNRMMRLNRKQIVSRYKEFEKITRF